MGAILLSCVIEVYFMWILIFWISWYQEAMALSRVESGNLPPSIGNTYIKFGIIFVYSHVPKFDLPLATTTKSNMPIRLRMAMHGGTHKKVFHIVAIDSKLRREAKPTELLGIYDPHSVDHQNTRLVRWSVNRLRYWLSVGAVPSKSVAKLLQLVSSCFGFSSRVICSTLSSRVKY